MRIMEPVLPREMETAIPLEEALAMAAAYEEPVYGYAFAGGSAPRIDSVAGAMTRPMPAAMIIMAPTTTG